jgi:hypothetical protein
MAGRAGAPLQEALPSATVPRLCDFFLEWRQKHNATRTYNWYIGGHFMQRPLAGVRQLGIAATANLLGPFKAQLGKAG